MAIIGTPHSDKNVKVKFWAAFSLVFRVKNWRAFPLVYGDSHVKQHMRFGKAKQPDTKHERHHPRGVPSGPTSS